MFLSKEPTACVFIYERLFWGQFCYFTVTSANVTFAHTLLAIPQHFYTLLINMNQPVADRTVRVQQIHRFRGGLQLSWDTRGGRCGSVSRCQSLLMNPVLEHSSSNAVTRYHHVPKRGHLHLFLTCCLWNTSYSCCLCLWESVDSVCDILYSPFGALLLQRCETPPGWDWSLSLKGCSGVSAPTPLSLQADMSANPPNHLHYL